QIQKPVVVVIAPGRAEATVVVRRDRSGCDPGKGSVAVVRVEQAASTPRRDEQVLKSIVVVIAPGQDGAVGAGNNRAGGNSSEGSLRPAPNAAEQPGEQHRVKQFGRG